MSIASEVERIKTNISDTYTALEAKGATMPTTQNSENLPSTVESLTTGGWDTSQMKTTSNMFYNSTATALDFTNFNTSNVTSMSLMFGNCSSLTKLDLSNFDTSNVTSMSSMFQSCSSLTELDLSGFNTSSLTTTTYMFSQCIHLETLDLRNWDISNITTGYVNMFYKCTSLTYVYVSDSTTKTFIDTALSNSGLSITSTIKS